MRDILFAIISLFLTICLHSCTSGSDKDKAIQDTMIDATKAVANNTGNKTLAVNVPIQELYKGMADSPDNKLGGLKVGAAAPNIQATLSDGKAFDLKNELKGGPIGIIFYRGFWCPKCTKHLEALQSELAELKEKGLRIYAVTPETEEYIEKTQEKSNIEIPFIHDNAHQIMDAYKVSYKVTEEYAKGVGGFAGVDLADSHGAEDAYLPVPATYLIGQDGKIFYAHYEHDYGKRATAKNMLVALQSI